MSLREVCFLIGRDDVVLWSDASDRPDALPDSRERWEAIWRYRDELVEIAHSHPRGPLAFSSEDVTTFEAIDAALGRALRYTIVTPGGVLRTTMEAGEPPWASDLRRASGLDERRTD